MASKKMDSKTPVSKQASSKTMVNKKQVLKKLEEVIDPELNLNIVDLGLIYEVNLEKNNVNVVMTFTTPACPLATIIAEQVETKLKELKFEQVHVHVTWDPPWKPDMLSEKAKAVLGF